LPLQHLRKFVPLAACAAIASAALAHYVIDVVNDFALAHDAYDDVQHASRGIAACVATLIAMSLALRGLRVCCELAAHRRSGASSPVTRRDSCAILVAGVVCSIVLVPLMEWCDGRLAGAPVTDLTSAFGGSIVIGIVTTICCALAFTLSLQWIVKWFCERRESIVAIVATLLGRRERFGSCCSSSRRPQRPTVRRRRATHALRLAKRGPPDAAFCSITNSLLTGDSCETHIFARVANAFGIRVSAQLWAT
jgi:hypothetical protein